MNGTAGCRPLDDEEIDKLKTYFASCDPDNHKDYKRDYTLIFLSLYTGWRISETLSLTVRDVWTGTQIPDSVYLKRCFSKGKTAGRTAVLNENVKIIIKEYLNHYGLTNKMNSEIFGQLALFPSPRDPTMSLSTRQCERIFKKAFERCGFTGKLATHTSRKSFAQKCYQKLGNDLVSLQQLMGHKAVSSTAHYITPNRERLMGVLETLKY
jgi:site-specific recombinase XerD